MNFSKTKHFKESEWPDGALEHMDQRVFDVLFELRSKLNCPMFPSPVFAGHVRHESSNSRHSTKEKTRLSDATDFFVEEVGMLQHVLVVARSIEKIGGIGIYFDTKPSVMFHIDTREDKLDWVRSNGKYIYLQVDPVLYYATLSTELSKL